MSDACHLSEQLRLARASTVSEFSKLMLTLPPTSSRAPRLLCQGSPRGSPSSSRKPLKQKHSTPQSLALDTESKQFNTFRDETQEKLDEPTPFLPHPIRSKGGFKALPPKAIS
jgi:hypothetical protein